MTILMLNNIICEGCEGERKWLSKISSDSEEAESERPPVSLFFYNSKAYTVIYPSKSSC